ncbi:MAG: RnfABCDGE type electron transport complex subunit G [Candidatus Omnitrophica bacterium]|nr:RnfABCDGE type electron transport complex subunit G [Candidatus Omnitrophota bacterium]
MSKKKDSMLKMICVLTITCIVAGVCLSFTYTKTKGAIANAELAATLISVEKVLPPFDGKPEEKKVIVGGKEKVYYIGRKDGAVVGIATASSTLGYGGTLNILVGVNAKGAITGIVLLQHQETPGLGSKAGGDDFLKQFKGSRLKSRDDTLRVKQDGGIIDAVTAATISSRAVAKAATNTLHLFLKHKDEIL